MSWERLNIVNEPYLMQDGQGIGVQRMHWWRYALTALQAAAPGAATVHAAIAMAVTAQTVTTSITNPLAPRALSITGNHADSVGSVIITGTNINNDPITETIVLNGAALVAGTKAFKTITSIYIPLVAAITNAPSVAVGTTDVMGLPLCLPSAKCLDRTEHNGVLEATAATVTVDADEIEKNTADPNSANAADHTLVFIGYIYS